MKFTKSFRKDLRLEDLEPRMVLSASPWTTLDQVPSSVNGGQPIAVNSFEAFSIDEIEMRDILSHAPLEFTPEAENPLTIELPAPDGSIARFAIVESQMMEPKLAEEFPLIQTYRGVGIDDPLASAVFDYTYLGFHAQVRSPNGTFFIDPYYHLDTSVYASYYRADMDFSTAAENWNELGVVKDGVMQWMEDNQFSEELAAQGSMIDTQQDLRDSSFNDHQHDHDRLGRGYDGDDDGDDDGDSFLSFIPRTGTQLRTYRVAVAATTEYTNYFGGTVPAGQSSIVTAMNRVSGVYEDELTIRMVLVANNSSIVYAGADPYSNNDSFAMLSQNQLNLDSVIGNSNYDIGHVFSTGGGGVAGLGVVGRTGLKAQGVTGRFFPTGDAFWIDYVAHEMGHQYGGSHTFNGCSGSGRSASSAYEPGSGSTIMAYAGICGSDNLQNNSDDHFHSRSLDQIVSFVDSSIPSVGTRSSTGNSVPTAEAGSNYTIPAETPFALTGSGSDPNGDTIRYNWEQRNLGPQQSVNAGDNGSSPIFRSWPATTNPTRTFPRLGDLLNNTTVRGETLPTTNRTLSFRLTVRDFNSAGGGVATDNMSVTVRNAAGPFLVTSPNTSVNWDGNGTETVTWNMAGTTGNGINTSQVNIVLSVDGGQTYPFTLASNTPNDGSEQIIVPNVSTTDARLKVEAVGNIFFDVSNQDFTINEITDVEDPVAAATAPDLEDPTISVQSIDVTYTDNQAIDVSDIGDGDIQVIAPDGSTLVALLSGEPSSPTDASPVMATYSIFPQGDFGEGLFDIRMNANQLTDTAGNPVPAGSIGSFTVASPTVPGDFDGDGDLDCNDIGALSAEIAAGTNDTTYDVTDDNLVDLDDLNEWVLNLKGTLFGDANLDFVVDTSDFNIWNFNKFTSGTGWCEGNFDGDNVTDTSDFNVWNDNKFNAAPRPVATHEVANESSGELPQATGPVVRFGADATPLENEPLADHASRRSDGASPRRYQVEAEETSQPRARLNQTLDLIFAQL